MSTNKIWFNKILKDPDRDAFEAERGEVDKDLEATGPGLSRRRETRMNPKKRTPQGERQP